MSQMDQPTDAKTLAEYGERALAGGHAHEALEIAAEGLKLWPNNVELLRIQARAWIKSDLPEDAHQILNQLYKNGDCHPETIGNLARTHKAFGLAADDPTERLRQLRQALEYYELAYDNCAGNYWIGINVATLATIIGKTDKGDKVARKVQEDCLQEWNASGGDRYWLAATLGEAALNRRDWSGAQRWYQQATQVSGQRYGDLSRTRAQARLLLKHLEQECSWLDTALPVPKVVVFVGHMCDQQGRLRPRFPEPLVPMVTHAIRDRLKEHNALVGFSSAACGSDILFLEALLNLQGEPHVVLPYEKDQFALDSVEIVPGWKERYDTVIEKLLSADTQRSRVAEVARGKMELESVSYDYANLVLHGLAMQRVKELETELVCLAVWDGKKGDGLGGTASVVERWRQQGLKVDHINLTEMLKPPPQPIELDPPSVSTAPKPQHPETKVMALLFADTVGFSKMTEKQAVSFTKHGLGAICRLLLDHPHEAIVRESRGDGVYVAFETVRDAGLFALELCTMVKDTKWEEKGLPADLQMRIGLHAGPVCRCFDPILGAQTWTGAHVSRAARFESAGLPGQVCASQQFAALAAMENVTEFSCVYVETKELPKTPGKFPIYIVRRRSKPAVRKD